ncbi:MAG: hypothetical protein AB7S26_30230 [Sandaracinaceae bacterium]
MSPRAFGVALAAMIVVTAGRASAQPIADDALHRAAQALTHASMEALAACDGGALLVRFVEELGPAARPGLGAALAEPLLAHLRAEHRWDSVHLGQFADDGREPIAVARRLGYASLLDVRVRVSAGHLAMSVTATGPSVAASQPARTVREPLDASLRAFIGYPATVTEETVDARFAMLPSRGYLALAVVDLDGDLRPELVLVQRDGVQVFRVAEATHRHRVERVALGAWPPEIPLSASPRRRPLATAVAAERAVIVRHSDLGAPVRLTLSGPSLTASRADGPCADDRYPTEAGCAALVDGRDFFDDAVIGPDGATASVPMHFYAIAAASLDGRDGTRTRFDALVNPAGRLVVRAIATSETTPHTSGALGYGTALELTDLDCDGSAELLGSHAAPAGAGDQLSLLRMAPGGGLRVVWRSEPLPGSIWIAGAGDVDSDGAPELLAIEEPPNERGRARLWVVQ